MIIQSSHTQPHSSWLSTVYRQYHPAVWEPGVLNACFPGGGSHPTFLWASISDFPLDTQESKVSHIHLRQRLTTGVKQIPYFSKIYKFLPSTTLIDCLMTEIPLWGTSQNHLPRLVSPRNCRKVPPSPGPFTKTFQLWAMPSKRGFITIHPQTQHH